MKKERPNRLRVADAAVEKEFDDVLQSCIKQILFLAEKHGVDRLSASDRVHLTIQFNRFLGGGEQSGKKKSA